MFELKRHAGVILEPSNQGFDVAASTFGCLFSGAEDKNYYLYYTGSIDTKWSKTSIGVARSHDGVKFVKYSGNPVISVGNTSVTPAVFKAKGRYWMVFAFKPDQKQGRRLGIAAADGPLGPWEFIKQLIQPELFWEGNDIDVGPSAASLSGEDHLVFYSNVSNKRFLNLIAIPRYRHRRIGILQLKISGSKDIKLVRWHKNPLSHLNGKKGSWNESLFCPGYFSRGKKHFLLTAASTYSVGFPYKQYIGLVVDSTPFFETPNNKNILINGSKEKKAILPNIKSEIALDSPSPLIRENELWLYYSIMDRADGIWKSALSIFSIN
jgi:hypothetical protein